MNQAKNWSALFEGPVEFKTDWWRLGGLLDMVAWTTRRDDGRTVAWIQSKEPMTKAEARGCCHVQPIKMWASNPISEMRAWVKAHPDSMVQRRGVATLAHVGAFKKDDDVKDTGEEAGREKADYAAKEIDALSPWLGPWEEPAELVQIREPFWKK